MEKPKKDLVDSIPPPPPSQFRRNLRELRSNPLLTPRAFGKLPRQIFNALVLDPDNRETLLADLNKEQLAFAKFALCHLDDQYTLTKAETRIVMKSLESLRMKGKGIVRCALRLHSASDEAARIDLLNGIV